MLVSLCQTDQIFCWESNVLFHSTNNQPSKQTKNKLLSFLTVDILDKLKTASKSYSNTGSPTRGTFHGLLGNKVLNEFHRIYLLSVANKATVSNS